MEFSEWVQAEDWMPSAFSLKKKALGTSLKKSAGIPKMLWRAGSAGKKT